MTRSTLNRPTIARILAASMIGATPMVLPAPPAYAAVDTESAQAFYQDAEKRYEAGATREAAIELKNALRRDPGHRAARRLLGIIRLEQGDFAAAEKELERAQSISATDEVEALLGESIMQQGRFRDVLDTVGETALDDELLVRKLLLRGAALIGAERPEEAEVIYARVLELAPGMIEGQYGIARSAAADGDVDRAAGLLDAMLADNPDYAPAWMLLGEVSLTRNDINGAFAAFDRALVILPDNIHALIARARAHLAVGQIDKARADAVRVQRLSPGNPIIGYMGAAISYAEGDMDSANDQFTRVQETFDTFAPAVLLGGLIKYRRGELTQAEYFLRRYTALNPSNTEAQRALAAVRAATGQPLNATQILDELIRDDPRDVESMRQLASVYLTLEKFDDAERLYRRISEIGPRDKAREARGALQLMGATEGASVPEATGRRLLQSVDRLREGNTDASAEIIDELLENAPGDPMLLTVRARVDVAKGDRRKARERLNAALRADAGFGPAHDALEALDSQAGDPGATRARLEELVAAHPGMTTLTLRYADHLSRSGDAVEAARFLSQRIAADPGSTDMSRALIRARFLANDVEAAAAEARRLSKIAAGNVDALTFALIALRDAGAAKDAVVAAERLTEAAPDSPRAEVLLIEMLARANYRTQARKRAAQAAKRWPGDIAVARAGVNLAVEENDLQGAVRAAKALSAKEPTASLRLHADALMRLAQPERAEALLAEALAAQPSTDVAVDLFTARRRAGRDDAAMEGMKAWLNTNSDDRRALMVYAATLVGFERYREAEPIYARLLANDPGNPIALNNYAWVRFELGRHDALDYAERAYRAASGSPEIADTLGWMLIKHGKLKNGLEVLRAAAGAAPDNGDIAYHLAYALDKSGQKAEAQKLLSDILKRGSRFDKRDQAEALLASLK